MLPYGAVRQVLRSATAEDHLRVAEPDPVVHAVGDVLPAVFASLLPA